MYVCMCLDIISGYHASIHPSIHTYIHTHIHTCRKLIWYNDHTVFLCVEHLNRSKTSIYCCFFFSFLISAGGRGMQSGTASNEATWLHGIQSLISSAYRLHFPICMASGQADNRPAVFSCLHKWHNLRLRWRTTIPIYFFGHLTLDPRDWSILFVSLVWSGRTEFLICCTTDAFHITIR